ncbi:MAG: orotate phosphoribosyltransferase [Firmicutes bacterium]|nr:orotate phosphoribosyltransferase [Bacillota bacterium]
MTKAEILSYFEKTGGMLRGHFILTSGRHSDTYMQCAKLFVDTVSSEKICTALSEKLKKFGASAIVSPAVGGILMGYEVARQLNIKNYFAERENGVFNLRRGFEIEKGAKVIVVEDVVTTGGSAKEVVNLLKNMDVDVVCVASIVDRSGGKADFGVPYESLIQLDIATFDSSDCPICKTGIPAIKPGSKGLK